MSALKVMLVGLSVEIASGLWPFVAKAEARSIDPPTRQEVQVLIEKGIDNFWVITGCSTEEQLRERVDQIFTGPLANEIYHDSVDYLRHPTDWPALKIIQLRLTRQADGIDVSADYIFEPAIHETHRGQAALHMVKTLTGWRINQRKYLEN